MSIRVLEIIPTLVRGGAEKQLTLLATRLPRDEFEVHVAVLTHDGPYRAALDAAGVPVTLINKAWKIDPAAYWRLKQHVGRLRPDVVHTWIFAANCYGRAAALRAGTQHIIAGERCVDRWKAWHELALDRYFARRTSRIAVNSSGVRDFYVQHGLPAEKFVVIPNGIEPAGGDKELDRPSLLRELGLPQNARLIGAVGRLWPQKRYKDLIWSAELLRAGRGGDSHLLIVGDGPLRERLQQFSEQVLLHEYVHFLGERDDVPRILRHLDCFWLGSGYEGQSNAMMEAMLAGVAVVATDIPGNRDLVVPDRTGFLVPVGDCAEIARKTHLLLENPDLARRMGEQARQHMLAEFTIDKMVQRYAALYREVVHGGNP